MEITWYGQSCFRIRERGCTVLTDPYSPDIGLRVPRLTATIITVSHQHEDHNNTKAVRGSAYVIHGPGEYEVGGVFVIGVPTFHDTKGGQERGKNTAYVIEMGDFRLCHLGDLGHVPSQEQIEQFSDMDVLFVPVGGRSTLTGARAAEVVTLLEPKLVIPMHYKVPQISANLDTAKRFLREMAVDAPEKAESLKIDKRSLGENTQVVLLELKQ